jgi:hypothetical protein
MLALASISASCSIFSGSEVYPVSDHDRQAVAENFSKLDSHVPYIQPVRQSPHVRLYKVAFDGTLNDRERVPRQEQKTIVAHISKLIDVDGDVHYYPGPGMQGESISWIDAMFGTSCIKVAEHAVADYENVSHRWRAADPNVEIRVFVTGFSRGAATARHFMNLVSERDAVLRQTSPTSNPSRFYALLFDTVSTGQTDRLKLSLPTELDYLVHFVALDESRPLFEPVIDVMPKDRGGLPIFGLHGGFLPDRINLVDMPGAHSDIGSSYKEGIGNEYIVLAEQITYLMGLHKKNCWDVFDDYFVYGKHDSRGLLDKLIGVHAPNQYGESKRTYIPKSISEVPPEQYFQLIQRLDALEHSPLGIAASMQTYRHQKLGLTLLLKRTGASLQIEGFEDDVHTIDPSSFLFVEENGVRKLKFHRNVTPQNTNVLVFDDTLWSYLPEDTVSVFNITRLERDGKNFLATFVDNKLISIVPSRLGDTLVFPSTLPRCEFLPNGEAVNPLKIMILSPSGKGGN